jgi:hypothetical protein
MSINPHDRCLDVLRDYVPGFVEQLEAARGLMRDVLATLDTPQACAHLEAAAKRWAHTRRTIPTFAQLQEVIEEMETERQREAALNRPSGSGPTAVGDVLHDTLGRMPPPDREADAAWAKMHIQLALDGVAAPRHLQEQLRRYDALAGEHPSLAGHCRLAIERLLAGRGAAAHEEAPRGTAA